MKFFIDNWMLISVAVASGLLLIWPLLRGVSVAGLAPSAAVQLMNREKAVVIDICEAAEFSAGHIVGSKNIPLDQLEAKLSGAVKNKGLPLIIVCQTGVRSARAVAIAKKLGHAQVQNLAGGLMAWRAAGLPVEKG